MAAVPATQDLVSFEDDLALDEASDERLELFRGRVFTMRSASGTHVVVQANLSGMCRNALRGKPCRFLGENAKVHVERTGSGYHPDGTIVCPLRFSNERAGVVENPQVAFEILSPGTEKFDRKGKSDDDASVPSIREIASSRPRRRGWRSMSDARTAGFGGSTSRGPSRSCLRSVWSLRWRSCTRT